MTLKEKISYEFQCFYLDMMRTSKENIFAHSAEIESKKQLVDELYLLSQNVDEAKESVLVLQDNLLESVYCFFLDVRQKKDESIREVVQNWLKFVLEKKERRFTKKNV